MEKKNLWNDAAKYGALIALVSIAFTVVGMYWTSGLLTFVSLVVFITLLYLFTKRRAMQYGDGERGYSYGQCLLFILCMMLFTGILEGAYQIVASNWLFAARYNEMMSQSLSLFENMGLYTDDQLEVMASMARRMLRSPVWLLFSSILGNVIKGLFFGLIVAIFARRTPDVFAGDNR